MYRRQNFKNTKHFNKSRTNMRFGKNDKWLPHKNSDANKHQEPKLDFKIPEFYLPEESVKNTGSPNLIIIGCPPDHNLILLAEQIARKHLGIIVLITN